jgi:anti-sigma B factor antagonist
MPFGTHVHDQHGLTVVSLAGELDVEPAANLRTLFDMLVEDRRIDVLVDLRRLTFCDSVGLSALIHGYLACQRAGGSFRLTGDSGLVHRLLCVTGLRGLLVDQPRTSDRSGGSGRSRRIGPAGGSDCAGGGSGNTPARRDPTGSG